MNCSGLIESNDLKDHHSAIHVRAPHHTAAQMVIVCFETEILGVTTLHTGRDGNNCRRHVGSCAWRLC